MKKSDLQWCAGVVDKGCAIFGVPNKNGFCIRVIISSTNAEIAMRFHQIVQTGKIKIVKRKWQLVHHKLNPRKSKIREVVRYCLFGRNAAVFLEQVKPFLKTQKRIKQVDLSLRLHNEQTKKVLVSLKKLGIRTKL